MEQALRYDQGKTRLGLIDPVARVELGKIVTFGAEKYAAHNWLKGMPYSKCIDSLHRHLAAFEAGEDLDPESGLPHMAHVMCNAMFLVSYQKRGLGTDDRIHTSIKPSTQE